MNILFWILWVFNLIAAIFTIMAAGFRGEMNLTTSTNGWLLLLFAAAMIGGLVLRFSLKFRSYSLWAVALPLLVLAVWWLVGKVAGEG